MKRFEITITRTVTQDVTIEADTEEEAIAKAYAETGATWFEEGEVTDEDHTVTRETEV